MKKKATDQDIEEMIRLKRKDLSNKKIGEKFGLAEATVGNYLREYMDDYKDHWGRKPMTEDEIREMIRLKKEKMSNGEISKRVGRSIITVAKYLKCEMEDYEKYKCQRKTQSKSSVSDNEIKRMMQLKRQYYSNVEIGEVMGMKKRRVGKILNNKMPDYDEYVFISSLGEETKEELLRRKRNKEYIDRIRNEVDEEELDSTRACMLVECRPTNDKFFDILEELSESNQWKKAFIFDYIRNEGKEKDITRSIKLIQKYLHKQNTRRKRKNVVAISMMLHTGMTVEEASIIIGVSSDSIREINRFIGSPIRMADQEGIIEHIRKHDPDLLKRSENVSLVP